MRSLARRTNSFRPSRAAGVGGLRGTCNCCSVAYACAYHSNSNASEETPNRNQIKLLTATCIRCAVSRVLRCDSRSRIKWCICLRMPRGRSSLFLLMAIFSAIHLSARLNSTYTLRTTLTQHEDRTISMHATISGASNHFICATIYAKCPMRSEFRAEGAERH